MPSYKHLTKAQLKQLCEQQGINADDCRTKAHLIDAIEQNDLRNDAVIEENNGDVEESTGEQSNAECVR